MRTSPDPTQAAALYEVLKQKKFVPSEASHCSKLRAMLTANLHLFSGKQNLVATEPIFFCLADCVIIGIVWMVWTGFVLAECKCRAQDLGVPIIHSTV